MNWQLLPQFATTGLLAGGPIALMALGLVLIFKSSYIFNFAQGQLLLIGALITWWFSVELGLPLWVSIARSTAAVDHPDDARSQPGAARVGAAFVWWQSAQFPTDFPGR